jgi:chaperone required for assembly of F1-ATPase
VSADDRPARRPYKAATLSEQGMRFAVMLDGKPARTPARKPLETSSRALGEALVAEWDKQGARIDPETMPMTRLLATAIDRVEPARGAVTAELLRYIDSDVLGYQAEGPQALRARQAALWEPVLQWLREAQGIALATTTGVMPQTQSEQTVKAMAAAIDALDRDRLTVLQVCAAATGSLALALALVHGRLTAAEAFDAAFVDETFQIEQWGRDPQAEARRGAIAHEIAAAETFLRLAISIGAGNP